MSELENKTAKTTEDTIDSIEPDDLMLKIRKIALMKGVILAVIIHIVVILLTSIGYISDCAKYKTVHVKAAKKIEAEDLKKKEEEVRKVETLKRLEAEAKKKLEDAKNKPAEEKVVPGSTEEFLKKNADKPVPPIIKELNETSKERPTGTSTSLDGDLL